MERARMVSLIRTTSCSMPIRTAKKIYGINTEGGRVVRMEGDISADGKTLTFTGSYPSSPKETYKMEVKMMGNMVSFKNTIMMDGKQVQIYGRKKCE